MHFTPPPPLSKAGKNKVYKKNRRMLKEIIRGALETIAFYNHMDKSNFGIIKILVEGHMYYYGVRLEETEKGEEVHAFNLKTYPNGQLDSFLENYFYDRDAGAVGIIGYKEQLVPVFMENDELVCRQA